MVILEACFSPALGGLELYCLNTARQLQDRGHEVLLWLAEGSRMAQHPLAQELHPTLSSPPPYLDFAFALRATRFIRARGIEIVHLHRSRDLDAFTPVRGARRVLTLQIESALPKRDLLHRYVYSRLDRLLTITDHMRELALAALPVEERRVFTLHYGIAADDLLARRGDASVTRRRFGIPADAFVIGMVGRLEPPKGQEVLLRAFARLAERYPQARLLFAGEPPPEHAGYDRRLVALAQESGVASRTHFAGFQTDTAPIFAALDVSVLASQAEAFGLVLLEAMAQGVPIVASRVGGVPEIIRDGCNGLLTPAGDVAALAQALARLIEDVGLRRSLGEEGYRVVRRDFRLDRHMEALEKHFAEVITTST